MKFGPYGNILSKSKHCFLSVVVITCASHAQGRRFEPGRKQINYFSLIYFLKGLLENIYILILIKFHFF